MSKGDPYSYTKFTKKDQKPMAAFRIEGLEGAVSAIMFADSYTEYGHHIVEDATAMFGGIWEQKRDSDELQFQVLEIFPFDTVANFFCERVSLHLPETVVNDQVMERLKETVTEFQGNTPLHLCIEFIDGPKVFIHSAHEYKVRPCSGFEQKIEHTLGEGLVYIAAKPDPLRSPPKERKWGKKKG